jgi:hypothetical protein
MHQRWRFPAQERAIGLLSGVHAPLGGPVKHPDPPTVCDPGHAQSPSSHAPPAHTLRWTTGDPARARASAVRPIGGREGPCKSTSHSPRTLHPGTRHSTCSLDGRDWRCAGPAPTAQDHNLGRRGRGRVCVCTILAHRAWPGWPVIARAPTRGCRSGHRGSAARLVMVPVPDTLLKTIVIVGVGTGGVCCVILGHRAWPG